MNKPTKPAKPKHPAFTALPLGPLPVDAINRTLGLELEPGDVVFSAAAQNHAFKRHGADFAACLPHVGSVVAKPSYLGDDFKNGGKIELVARIAALGTGLLVALSLEQDASGVYYVTSTYPINERTIENRRQNKRLKITQTK